jgi:hypothetical protein
MASFPRRLAFAILLAIPEHTAAQLLVEHPFDAQGGGEAVASITAACERCDWGTAGREAAALRLSLDGVYSQHLLLTRGAEAVEYRVLLGSVAAGAHRLTIEWDGARSAREVKMFGPDTAEHAWLARAPIVHARPGTLERFSDVPLMMYAERAPEGADGYSYTVIFSHEDGGTPTDRLMATWGRTTDIEFVYGFTRPSDGGPLVEEYQGVDHEILPFRGPTLGAHPLLWVSTDNNMVTDAGPADAIRFAPAPSLVHLDGVSREAVMDARPWLYAVASAEIRREGRIDPAAQAGSGNIPDPRRFAVIEACGDLKDATLAFDLGVRVADEVRWHASDRGNPRFRIARSGCFRAAVPLAGAVAPAAIAGLRARAYTRPARNGEAALPDGTGTVVLRQVTGVLMLDEAYVPAPTPLRWQGVLELKGESPAVGVPATAR